MIRKLAKLSSRLILLVFLLPTAVKLEHHHEHDDCQQESTLLYHSFHEDCDICNFEFAAFCQNFGISDLEKENPSDNYRNHYRPANYSGQSESATLLRGPPC